MLMELYEGCWTHIHWLKLKQFFKFVRTAKTIWKQKKIPQQLSQSIEQIEKRETTVPNVLHSLYCCVDLKVKTNAIWMDPLHKKYFLIQMNHVAFFLK